jgi:hypothetical protein
VPINSAKPNLVIGNQQLRLKGKVQRLFRDGSTRKRGEVVEAR